MRLAALEEVQVSKSFRDRDAVDPIGECLPDPPDLEERDGLLGPTRMVEVLARQCR